MTATPEQRYQINPHVHVTHCGGDEVLIKHGSRSRFSHVLRDDGRTKLLGRILRSLDGPASIADLRERQVVRAGEDEAAQELLTYLARERIVITPDEYLPHVYLSMLFGESTAENVRSKRLGVLGAGFLGSRVARELGRLRVRSIALLDERRSGPHDAPYFDFAVGEPGTSYLEITRRGLAGDGYQAVELLDGERHDPRALAALFEGCDFVIAALESLSPSVLHAANETALSLGRPWMSVYVDGSEALIGPLYVPGETLCYNEFAVQNEAASTIQDDYLTHKETLASSAVDRAHLVLPPLLGVTYGWAVTAAVGYLTGGACPLLGRALRVDFERLSVDHQDVLKLPRCPACVAHRPAYRHTFL